MYVIEWRNTMFTKWCVFVFTIFGCKCYFVYESRNESQPFLLFKHFDRIVSTKLFDKLPKEPSPKAGRQLLMDLDEYNLSFVEYLHYFVFNRIRFLYSTREFILAGGPLSLQRTINETLIKEKYCFNETDMEELAEQMNTTNVLWLRLTNALI